MLYCITKIVNLYEQFRTLFLTDGTLVIYNVMLTCYTVFQQEIKTFSSIRTGFSDDYDSKRRNIDQKFIVYTVPSSPTIFMISLRFYEM